MMFIVSRKRKSWTQISLSKMSRGLTVPQISWKFIQIFWAILLTDRRAGRKTETNIHPLDARIYHQSPWATDTICGLPNNFLSSVVCLWRCCTLNRDLNFSAIFCTA